MGDSNPGFPVILFLCVDTKDHTPLERHVSQLHLSISMATVHVHKLLNNAHLGVYIK